jgi:hypothetical protein
MLIPVVQPITGTLTEVPAVRYERLAPIETRVSRQAYDFGGTGSRARPWVLWGNGMVGSPKPTEIGIVIPYVAGDDDGYLVFVPVALLGRA